LDKDNLTVDPDGTFFVDGLRDTQVPAGILVAGNPKIITYTWHGDMNDPDNIVFHQLRVTMAFPTDHRISASKKLSVSPLTGIEVVGPLGDETRIENGLNRILYAYTEELYAYEIANGSYPQPESVGGVVKNMTIRNDIDYIDGHSKKKMYDYGLLNRSGWFTYEFIDPTYEPGAMVRDLLTLEPNGGVLDTYPINSVITEVHFTPGQTKVVLGATGLLERSK
jgi:hypothetical protein